MHLLAAQPSRPCAGHYLEDHPYENTMRWLARHHVLDLPLQSLRVAAPVLERFRPPRTRLARTLIRRFLFGAGDADPVTVAMVQQLLEEPPLSVLSTLDLSVLRHDAVDALDVLREISVHVVSGDSDHLSRADHARRIRAALGPSAAVTVLAGVGHALSQTRAVEVNAAIQRLLDEVGDAESRGRSENPPLPAGGLADALSGARLSP